MAPGGEDNSSQQRQQPSTVAGADAPKLRISLGGGAGQGSRPAGKASTPVSAPTRSAAKRSSTVAAVAPAAAGDEVSSSTTVPQLTVRVPTPSASHHQPGASGTASAGPSPRIPIPSPKANLGAPSAEVYKPEGGANGEETEQLGKITSGAAQNLRLLHQRTEISLAYREGQWSYGGETTLWLIDEGTYGVDPKPPAAAPKETVEGAPREAEKATPPPRRMRDIALHLRGGCEVESVAVQGCFIGKNESNASSKNESSVPATAVMRSFPSTFLHFDPLETVLRKPASSYSVDEFEVGLEEDQADGLQGASICSGRCHADSQSGRGGAGMMDGLRAASVASRIGELRIAVGNPSSLNEGDAGPLEQQIALSDAMQGSAIDAWTSSLSRIATRNKPGKIVRRLRTRLVGRCEIRREGRIKLVSESLARATVGSVPPGAFDFIPAALKVTITFALPSIPDEQIYHAGGIHFAAPSGLVSANPVSPHVYTTTGIHGDHDGPRSWLPTLDSASSKHRASHELTVKVTAEEEEGLWSAGVGEDFGCGEGIGHCSFPASSHDSSIASSTRSPIVGSELGTLDSSVGIEERVRDVLSKALGVRHVEFCSKFLGAMSKSSAETRGSPHVIPPDYTDASHLARRLVTSVWTTASWSPVPARSLAFATGPFRALYDPEYYAHDEDDDDDEELEKKKGRKAVSIRSGADQANQTDTSNRGHPSVEELALRRAEGIRQLYFAVKSERKEIYANAQDISGLKDLFDEVFSTASEKTVEITGIASAYSLYHDLRRRRSRMPSHTPTRPTLLQQRLDIEAAILRSTSGVPNRALSLTRDVLALPSYRASSHTQIWIPAAVDGGSSSGSMRDCPEAGGCNPFLGGAIFDAATLPPPGKRLPYHAGGRSLQFMQARAAIRGWVVAALPLGSQDDVGMGYLYCIVESVLMGLYEKGHGAWGEGGARASYFFSPRFAIGSGLNSPSLEFLPLPNVDEDLGMGGAAVSVEEKGSDHLWRNSSNGTESHSSALDDHSIRHLLVRDVLDYFERQDKYVALPGNGWAGSHFSATFLSSNSTSSSAIGCGAVELMHPIGGIVYRNMKAEILRRVVEGRASFGSLVRVIRAAFVAALLEDSGEAKLTLPEDDERRRKKKKRAAMAAAASSSLASAPTPLPGIEYARPMPPFATCVDEMIKKGGLTHMTFARALRILSGPSRESFLRGSLIDVDRDVTNSHGQTTRQLIEPENFPNSFVRGASSLYLRVGTHVEQGGASGQSDVTGAAGVSTAVKGTQLHVFAEPVIPHGGITFCGPITLRVVENEGQCREFVKSIPGDGSRIDWGPVFLHANPVTTRKEQTAAAGTLEGQSSSATGENKSPEKEDGANSGSSVAAPSNSVFTQDANLHGMGYQALELIRLTNCTPLLWLSVDPHGMYGGRITVVQPDACLAEKLFHDGEAANQVGAIRALAERPLRIQGSTKVKAVYDVDVAELPVRILGDCLRGSAALHRQLPHTPAVRVQAALAVAQWQNNNAPDSTDVVGSDWIGLNLLLQYFKERWRSGDVIMPVHFTRTVCKRHSNTSRGGDGREDDASGDNDYIYIDTIPEVSERRNIVEEAEAVQIEEDEEYRVRSAVITAIASVRAKDGLTPPTAVRFLETVISAGDGSASGNAIVTPGENELIRKKRLKRAVEQDDKEEDHADSLEGGEDLSDTPFVSARALGDALLALCHVNVRPALIEDPATGAYVQSKAQHPVLNLMAICHRWLEWDLYREDVRMDAEADTMTGVGGECYSTVSACAITALSSLALLKQSTTDASFGPVKAVEEIQPSQSPLSKRKRGYDHTATKLEEAATAKYYIDIFDSKPPRADSTRAAAAWAITCICCAADRMENPKVEPMGLLTALEFLLDRIEDLSTSPGLCQCLAGIMFDACTGKVCTMQRAAIIGGRNDLFISAARFTQGPLGANHGGDNGSASLVSVTEDSHPAANAVNDGARQGLRLLNRAGRDNAYSDRAVVRVAKLATKLWRSINGEALPLPEQDSRRGACALDGHLRCNLLALWQWIWPKTCIAVLRVQSWGAIEGTPRYVELGADQVMKLTQEEKDATKEEDAALQPLKNIVASEIDRQSWRGEMSLRAHHFNKREQQDKVAVVDPLAGTSQDLGKPLPLVQKDAAWKSGGWITSTAQQRRAKGVDGGSAITKIRLTVKGSSGD